jgi:hypothetical protein
VFLADPLTTPTVAGVGLIVGAAAMGILGSQRKAVVRVPRVETGEQVKTMALTGLSVRC